MDGRPHSAETLGFRERTAHHQIGDRARQNASATLKARAGRINQLREPLLRLR